MSTDADRRYHALHPVEAVVAAWDEPGISRHMHATTRREVARLAPHLAKALDQLAKTTERDDRSEVSQLATESVAGSLLALYGQVKVVGDCEGAELVDGCTAEERWRRATVIVNELVRVGLI